MIILTLPANNLKAKTPKDSCKKKKTDNNYCYHLVEALAPVLIVSSIGSIYFLRWWKNKAIKTPEHSFTKTLKALKDRKSIRAFAQGILKKFSTPNEAVAHYVNDHQENSKSLKKVFNALFKLAQDTKRKDRIERVVYGSKPKNWQSTKIKELIKKL